MTKHEHKITQSTNRDQPKKTGSFRKHKMNNPNPRMMKHVSE